jgi:hypothetical protein
MVMTTTWRAFEIMENVTTVMLCMVLLLLMIGHPFPDEDRAGGNKDEDE